MDEPVVEITIQCRQSMVMPIAAAIIAASPRTVVNMLPYDAPAPSLRARMLFRIDSFMAYVRRQQVEHLLVALLKADKDGCMLRDVLGGAASKNGGYAVGRLYRRLKNMGWEGGIQTDHKAKRVVIDPELRKQIVTWRKANPAT